jgi:hypothetical protein
MGLVSSFRLLNASGTQSEVCRPAISETDIKEFIQTAILTDTVSKTKQTKQAKQLQTKMLVNRDNWWNANPY